MEEEPKKISPFRTELKKLYKVLHDTVDIKSHKGKKKAPPIQITYLDKYINLFNKVSEEDEFLFHKGFINVYNTNKNAVLSMVIDDELKDKWLLDTDNLIIIQLDAKKFDKHKILLSRFYDEAVRKRKNAEERAEKSLDDDDANNIDLIKSNIILYHLYKIWKILFPDEQKLDDIIEFLRGELGMDEGDEDVESSSSTSSGVKMPEFTPDLFKSGGFGKLFGLAKTVMEQTGIDDGGEQKFDAEDFDKVFSNVINSDGTKNMINGVLEKSKNTSDIGGLIETMTETIKSGSLEKTIRESVESIENKDTGGVIAEKDDDSIVIIKEEEKESKIVTEDDYRIS